ncbi:uncharacterized protein LOC106641101 [Copidosoma floridanum]|uniref:uncharacterized protein LOC106641101 n=1 Tax=Copidosoma floridanum TaxID=29053 RepID=UPI0006C979F1|nr:uncharacterized protein LOC106641101 [Copidosoma floridanum]
MCSRDSTVMYELQKVQDVIQHINHRIGVLQKKLAQKLEIENRESLEIELEDAKKVLKKNEELLKKLRKDNTKTFIIVACIIFALFLIFGLYNIIFNPY